MPRRTLADARQLLEEDLIPRVSDYVASEYRRQLEAAEQEARQHADQYTAARDQEIRSARDEALRELTAVRDALDDLASEGKTGRMPAEAYAEELGELRQRQTQAEELLRQAEQKAAQVETIEADPIAWFDDLARRHPRLLPEVSW